MASYRRSEGWLSQRIVKWLRWPWGRRKMAQTTKHPLQTAVDTCAACRKAGDWRGALFWADAVWLLARRLGKYRLAMKYGGFIAQLEAHVNRVARERGVKLADLDRLDDGD